MKKIIKRPIFFCILFPLIVWLVTVQWKNLNEIKTTGTDEIVEVMEEIGRRSNYKGPTSFSYSVTGPNGSYRIGSYSPLSEGEKIQIIVRPNTYSNIQFQTIGSTKDPTYLLFFKNQATSRIVLYAFMLFAAIYMSIQGSIASYFLFKESKFYKYQKNRVPYKYDDRRSVISSGVDFAHAKEKLEDFFVFESSQESGEVIEYSYIDKRNSSSILRFSVTNGKVSEIY